MNLPPDSNATRRPWIDRAGWTVPLACGALVGIAIRLLYWGKANEAYNVMTRSFVMLVPILVSAVAVYVAERVRRRKWSDYFFIGAGANGLFVLGCFLIMIEGLICVVIAAPLFGVLGGFAGLAMGAVCRWTQWPRRAIYGIASLPILLGAVEQRLPIPDDVRDVERSCVIAAAPAQVWTHLIAAKDIRPSEIGAAWMYRIGVPLPLSAVTGLSDGERVRHITMGKGIHFDQVAADWQPNQRVRWLYRFSKDSFPAGALDDHVRIGGAYFDLLDTEYTLRPVQGGTELHVRMSYRVSTPFNWYAAPIADFFASDFEAAALSFYAHRALADVHRD